MNKGREWLIIPEYDRLEASAQLAEMYHAAFEYNDFYVPGIYNDPEEVEKRIAAYCALPRDRSRDTLHGVFLDMVIASRDVNLRKYSREKVAQSMEIAGRLGICGVVFHTGLMASLNYGAYLEVWLEAAEEVFRPLCRQYPQLCIYMENTFEQTPEVFERLMHRMGDLPNFALCLDYAHAVLTPTPPEIWVKTLAPHIRHIHLNDNDLKKDLHLVPGEGKIDYAQFVQLLRSYQVHAPILLELKGLERQEKALTALAGML